MWNFGRPSALAGRSLLEHAPGLRLRPLLKSMPAHLRIFAAQSSDVRAVADTVKPLEHLGVVFVRCPQLGNGDFHVLDLASGNAGDNLSCLTAGDFVGGDVKPFAEKLLAAL